MPKPKALPPSDNSPEPKRASLSPPYAAALAATVLCTAAAHGFLFTNEFFSHDSVSYFAYADWKPSFYIGVGRFLIPLYEACKGGVAAPWLIGSLFAVWMCLTALIVTDLLEIRTVPGAALAAGLLCTNLSLTLTGATYVYCMDEYALALLLASGAAWLFARGGRLAFFGVVPLLLSLSIYQPYGTVTAALSLLAFVRQAADGRRTNVIIRRGVLCLLLLAAAFAAYSGLWALLRFLFHTRQTRDVIALETGGPGGLLERVVTANRLFIGFLFRPGGVLGYLRPVAHGAVLILFFWRLLRTMFNARVSVPNRVLILALSALVPAALYSSALAMPGEAHDLTAYARELFCFLPFVLPDERRAAVQERAILCAALSLLLWHHIVFANQAYMKKDLEKNSTLILAARIIDRIESVPGYTPGKTRVAFAGRLDDNEPLDQTRAALADLAPYTGLWHSHAATYNLGRYLTDYLQYPLLWDTETGVTRSDLAQSMPAFPAEGSVRMIDGVVVVKLSG